MLRVCLLVVLGVYVVPLLGMDETVLVRRLRDTELSLAGAATETQRQVLTTLRSQTLRETVTVNSAVVVRLPSMMEARIGVRAKGCQRDLGDLVGGIFPLHVFSGWYRWRDEYLVTPAVMTCAEWQQNAERAGLATKPARTFTLADEQPVRYVIATKDHQDGTITYHLLFPTKFLNDLRVGQKISFDATILGIDTQTNNHYNVGVSTSTIKPETTMLKCDNGHEYAPSSGYTFCPLDGTRLK